MIIAIDGPAAAGKGTLARRLAGHFGYAHLDTGLLYRAVAGKLLAAGGDPADSDAAAKAAQALTQDDLNRDGLRTEAVGRAASVVAAQARVRAALLDYQRRFAADPPDGAPGAVLDGRDVGTVVLPGADAKIYVSASDEARAARRHKELLDRGVESIRADVLRDMRERDARDSERAHAPLAQAPDAFLLETTDLDADAAFAAALSFVLGRLESRRMDQGVKRADDDAPATSNGMDDQEQS